MASAPSITAQKGRAFLLKVGSSTSPTTFSTVGGLRATNVTFNGNPVDITSKSSNGWQELLPDGGVKQFSFSASGVYDSASAAYALLQAACLNQTLIEAEVVSGAGDAFIGTFSVSTFQRDGTHNDAETFSLTLMSSGPVTYDAA